MNRGKRNINGKEENNERSKRRKTGVEPENLRHDKEQIMLGTNDLLQGREAPASGVCPGIDCSMLFTAAMKL
jgi:hypothetical protein